MQGDRVGSRTRSTISRRPPRGQRALRWAALSGLALAFALLTKQLAVLPIVALELWRRVEQAQLHRWKRGEVRFGHEA